MAAGPRDENREPSLIAKSDADNTVVVVEADPITKRLKVNTTVTGDVNVTATDLDIRNLVFATDKVDASGSTVGTSTATVNVNQQTTNTTAVQLSAVSTVPTNGILVGALSTNADPIFIGGSGVTTSNGAELLPGASLPFTCNLNTLYIRSASSTTDKVWWNVA